jgi:hypothetical protein
LEFGNIPHTHTHQGRRPAAGSLKSLMLHDI